MKIETITRYSFVGDLAQEHAKRKHKEAKMIYGKLVSGLVYHCTGTVSFEVVITAY